MAQRDLPLPGLQVRFFLGLLGRRRWLIVPLCLLGLVAGLVSALLVPRFYRAGTEVELKDVSIEGNPVSRPNEDPMEAKVENARFTLTSDAMILKAARELRWQEYFTPSSSDPALRALLAAARERVSVYLVRSHRTAGASGVMGISYSDKDANRAADLANTLRNLWLNDQRRAVQEDLEAALAKAKEREQEARQKWIHARGLLEEWETAHRLAPLATKEQGPGGNELSRRRELLAGAALEEEAALARLRERERRLLEEIAALPRLVDPGSLEQALPAEAPQVQALRAQIAQLEHRLSQVVTPEHPAYRTLALQLESLKAELRLALGGTPGEANQEQVENPLIAVRSRELEETRQQILEFSSGLAERRRQLAELEERAADFPKIHNEHVRRDQAVQMALTRLEEAEAQISKEMQRWDSFNSRRSWDVISEAYPPAAPNDPNNLIVILIGLAVGFGVAGGLVLLSELLRISFRSVEEAERILAVPVLGAVEHIDTEEEIRDRRRRFAVVSGVGGALLIAFAALVALFFYDQARLPAFVSSALQQVFGP